MLMFRVYIDFCLLKILNTLHLNFTISKNDSLLVLKNKTEGVCDSVTFEESHPVIPAHKPH